MSPPWPRSPHPRPRRVAPERPPALGSALNFRTEDGAAEGP